MKSVQKKGDDFLIIGLGIVIIVLAMAQLFGVSSFNELLHQVQGPDYTESSYMDIHYRGGSTSTWYKMNDDIYGSTYDGYFYNNSSDLVEDWTLRINIHGDCWLNQFWNGMVEIHQHVKSGQEIVQLLDLAAYEKDLLRVDHIFSETDLLIPLSEGDYIIYYPSSKVGELPIQAREHAVVGLIVYYEDSVDLSDYSVEYQYHREFNQGPLFIILCIMLGVWVVIFAFRQVFLYSRRKTEKELEYRMKGISCMSEIYAIIYVVDLVKDEIIPVGADEDSERARPKDLGASEQFRHLFQVDPLPAYRDIMTEFTDLSTIPSRMEDRNSLVVEYESQAHGWCRIRFIAMDRVKDKPLEKVLFTIEEISQEKQELESIMGEAAKAETEIRAMGVFLENMSRGIWSPLYTIQDLNREILKDTKEEETANRAGRAVDAGDTLQFLVDDIREYTRLKEGRIGLKSKPYSLSKLAGRVLDDSRYKVESRGLSLETDIVKGIPDELSGDSERIYQILINLIAHAITHTATGKITLCIAGKKLEDGYANIMFSIKDTGSIVQLDVGEDRTGRRRSMEEEEASIYYQLAEGLVKLMDGELQCVGTYGYGNDMNFMIRQKVTGTGTVQDPGSDSKRG